MMAKNDDIDKQMLAAVTQKVANSLEQGFSDKYANDLKDRIKKRTRLGTGVNGKPFNALKSAPYKQQRRRSRLSAKTTPAKSNVTATGQLVDSLTVVKAKLTGAVSYVFKIGDNRGRDLGGKSSKIGNKQLNKYVEGQGRKWLGLTKAQLNEIQREIRQFIRKFSK